MAETFEVSVAGRALRMEVGRVAKQANGAVWATMGDTVVLATATFNKRQREGIDWFPLVCDFEERMGCVGKIPGGFIKREGRPSERAILISRMIDRPIRPLFPQGMRNEVQVIAMPLSVDYGNLPDVVAITAASAALHISDIPFGGPVAAVRLGRIDGEYVVNPSSEQVRASDFEMVAVGNGGRLMQIEVAAKQVPDDEIAAAVEFAMAQMQPLIEMQEQMRAKVGKEKIKPDLVTIDEEVYQAVQRIRGAEIEETIRAQEKEEREEAMELLKQQIIETMAQEFPEQEYDVAQTIEDLAKKAMRKLILETGRRPDGRRPDQIREIACEVGILPRTHGSALFARGQTQALNTVTLGSLADVQVLDTIHDEEEKRYMHNYNFPPFSVGETRMLRGPGRREIGHGVLAEKAILPLRPEKEDFPYAIRSVTEILESCGSTSMASTCASSLALMDAGVPLEAACAGIAMGMISDGDDKFTILSDLRNIEDFGGDMDFKIAGTHKGVTSVQMDTKLQGLTVEMVRATFAQARPGREYILDKMALALARPREELSPYAPRVFVIHIDPEKIGDVIGPGGKMIKKITAETGAEIDIEQDGTVYVHAVDAQAGEEAKRRIEQITRDVEVGATYTGKVVRIESFGAFIEILPGKDGLLRTGEVAGPRISRIQDAFKMGDEVTVKVMEIDSQGRVNLTQKEGDRTSREGAGRDRGGRERGGPPSRGKPGERRGTEVGATFRPKRRESDYESQSRRDRGGKRW
jgi:polyribonucleotide nucleotidyltransferase